MAKVHVRLMTVAVAAVVVLQVGASVAEAATIRVRAYIDGRSQLMLSGNTAQWRHYEWGGPGYDDNLPTTINSAPWYPQWSGDPRDCGGCTSNVFTGVQPAISAVDQTVTLIPFDVRDSATIVQQPLASNDYTLIVELNDNVSSGGYWYTVDLDVDYVEANVPTLSQWGIAVLTALTALSAVMLLRRRRTA